MKLYLVLSAVCISVFFQVIEGDEEKREIQGRGNIIPGALQIIANILGGTKLKSACQAKVQNSALVRTVSNGKVYFIGRTPKNWANARADCIARGMHLASIQTISENGPIIELIHNDAAIGVNTTDLVWIGLTDPGATGAFAWDFEGTAATFTYFGVAPTAGQCGGIRKNNTLFISQTRWETANCTNVQPYLCELEAPCNQVVTATNRDFS